MIESPSGARPAESGAGPAYEDEFPRRLSSPLRGLAPQRDRPRPRPARGASVPRSCALRACALGGQGFRRVSLPVRRSLPAVSQSGRLCRSGPRHGGPTDGRRSRLRGGLRLARDLQQAGAAGRGVSGGDRLRVRRVGRGAGAVPDPARRRASLGSRVGAPGARSLRESARRRASWGWGWEETRTRFPRRRLRECSPARGLSGSRRRCTPANGGARSPCGTPWTRSGPTAWTTASRRRTTRHSLSGSRRKGPFSASRPRAMRPRRSWTSVERHPLPRLLAAGVRVALCADDPLLFATTTRAEYRLARERLGVGRGRSPPHGGQRVARRLRLAGGAGYGDRRDRVRDGRAVRLGNAPSAGTVDRAT